MWPEIAQAEDGGGESDHCGYLEVGPAEPNTVRLGSVSEHANPDGFVLAGRGYGKGSNPVADRVRVASAATGVRSHSHADGWWIEGTTGSAAGGMMDVDEAYCGNGVPPPPASAEAS